MVVACSHATVATVEKCSMHAKRMEMGREGRGREGGREKGRGRGGRGEEEESATPGKHHQNTCFHSPVPGSTVPLPAHAES